jgi:hypothetical protein
MLIFEQFCSQLALFRADISTAERQRAERLTEINCQTTQWLKIRFDRLRKNITVPLATLKAINNY